MEKSEMDNFKIKLTVLMKSCFRPAGNVIACSQQDANKHKIIFFETNGLQHGEFSLPFKPNTHRVSLFLKILSLKQCNLAIDYSLNLQFLNL